MVQPYFLSFVAIVIAIISLQCTDALPKNNDHKRMKRSSNFDLDDIDRFGLENLDRAGGFTAEKWLKRSVRRLWRAFETLQDQIDTNAGDVTDLLYDVGNNTVEIEINAANITSNEEDILENSDAISDTAFDVANNTIDIGSVFNSTMDLIANNTAAIANNSADIDANEAAIQVNAMDIDANYDLLAEALGFAQKSYLTFGGFDNETNTVDHVFLVEIDFPNNVTRSCLHSTLPSQIKESHVFEWQDSLLVCTSFTKSNKKNLWCYFWNTTTMVWDVFDTPDSNGIFSFIQSVQVPGYGIWFTTVKSKQSRGIFLNETTGAWSTDLLWPVARNRGCMIRFNDSSVAHIGGSPTEISDQIDIYNFETETFSTDAVTMAFNRTHLSCALIPQNENGNPTVAIIGDDNSGPGDADFSFEMTLWDTVTNDITVVAHPPGYEDARMFRPVMATWDENTLFLAASSVKTGEAPNIVQSLLAEQWIYKPGEGWTDMGPIDPPMISEQLYDVYMLDNPSLGAYSTLNTCP